jgi:hypothetical protein
VLIGPDNTHAMFDDQVSTATTRSTPLTVVLSTGLANAMALFGLVGTQVTITVTDGAAGPTVYSRTVNLDGTFIFDWYQYFFEPYVQVEEVVLTDLPPYASARMTVSVSGSGTVAIGQLVFGNQYELGDAEYGASLGIVDYSRKETDEFGITTFVERAFSKRMNVRLMLDTVQVARVAPIAQMAEAEPVKKNDAEPAAVDKPEPVGFDAIPTYDTAAVLQQIGADSVESITTEQADSLRALARDLAIAVGPNSKPATIIAKIVEAYASA